MTAGIAAPLPSSNTFSTSPPGTSTAAWSTGAWWDTSPFIQLHLVRHGEADYQPIDSRGWAGLAADLAPLSEAGVKQAEAAADDLITAGATYLVSAPAARTLQTAAVIGHRLALGVRVEFDLHDWMPDRSGSWRGQAGVRAAYDDFVQHGGEWPDGGSRPWEPLSAVRERVTAALRRHARGTDGPVIVVCHSMVIRALTGDPETDPGGNRWYSLDTTTPQA